MQRVSRTGGFSPPPGPSHFGSQKLRYRPEAYFLKFLFRKRFLLKKHGGRGYGRIEPPPGPSHFGSQKRIFRSFFLRELGSPNPGQSFGRGQSGPQATEVKMDPHVTLAAKTSLKFYCCFSRSTSVDPVLTSVACGPHNPRPKDCTGLGDPNTLK